MAKNPNYLETPQGTAVHLESENQSQVLKQSKQEGESWKISDNIGEQHTTIKLNPNNSNV